MPTQVFFTVHIGATALRTLSFSAVVQLCEGCKMLCPQGEELHPEMCFFRVAHWNDPFVEPTLIALCAHYLLLGTKAVPSAAKKHSPQCRTLSEWEVPCASDRCFITKQLEVQIRLCSTVAAHKKEALKCLWDWEMSEGTAQIWCNELKRTVTQHNRELRIMVRNFTVLFVMLKSVRDIRNTDYNRTVPRWIFLSLMIINVSHVHCL